MPVTANVYQRVLRFDMPDGSRGTAFTMDIGETQYLVTAEHVVSKQPHAVSGTLHGNGWEASVELERLDGVTGGADIAVFPLPEPLTPQLPVEFSLAKVVYTQDVYFLGFPYGLGFTGGNVALLPFVKKGILSASTLTSDKGHVHYLDGFNNPGFSGGPVAFYTAKENEPHIGAVISGYRADERRVRVGEVEIDATVIENTGIVIAYDIKHARDAVEAAAG